MTTFTNDSTTEHAPAKGSMAQIAQGYLEVSAIATLEDGSTKELVSGYKQYGVKVPTPETASNARERVLAEFIAMYLDAGVEDQLEFTVKFRKAGVTAETPVFQIPTKS